MAKKKKVAGKPGVSKSSKGSSGFPVVIAIIGAAIFILGITAGVMAWALTKGDSAPAVPKPPDFAFGGTVPKGTAEAYQFAIDNSDTLAQIPCYCGCGQLDGHTSNLDCFIQSRNGNDIVFDKHAAG